MCNQDRRKGHLFVLSWARVQRVCRGSVCCRCWVEYFIVISFSDLFYAKGCVNYSIGTELASKIASAVNPMTYISNIENSIFVPDVTENNVWNVIAQLNNSSAWWDHFPAIVAKQCIPALVAQWFV